MKKSLPVLFAVLISFNSYSQVISSFTWNSNPVTQAVVGPNAISVSSSAISSTGGATGNGLNPGNPKKDIDLVLPGANFDVPGVDISIKYRREESEASFFKRSSKFDFGVTGGNLVAKFTIDNGSGGSVTINSGAVMAVPNDHAFHTYRFIYNSSLGKAQVFFDGTAVYTYNGTAGRVLAWNGSGNVVIGSLMDGTGNNTTVLDDLVIMNVPINATLPVKLTAFTAQPQVHAVALSWTATKEEHFSHFVVERSADGTTYAPIATVFSAGSYNAITAYSFTDKTPFSPVSYYRLKLIDENGNYSYSEIRTATFGTNNHATLSAFPNPAKNVLNVRVTHTSNTQYRYSILSLNGKVEESKFVTLSAGQQIFTLNLSANMQSGVYMLEVENISTQTKQSFKIVKL